MANFVGGVDKELLQMFETLEADTDKMLAEMVTAGAKVAEENVKAKMPSGIKKLMSSNVKLTKVYKTPSDSGTNCQVVISGYFVNRHKQVVAAPLVANIFEYGRSGAPYPKKPFLRSSFNEKQITDAMLKVQEKYIKGE